MTDNTQNGTRASGTGDVPVLSRARSELTTLTACPRCLATDGVPVATARSVSAERAALATIERIAKARATTDQALRNARGWLDVLAVIERVQL